MKNTQGFDWLMWRDDAELRRRQNPRAPVGRLLARTKYRFDLGSFPIPYLILAVSLIGASDKLAAITGWPSRWIILLGVPALVAIVFGLGWFLDRIRFPHYFQEEANDRNPTIQRILKQTGK